MKFEEKQQQCRDFGYIKSENGVDVCGLSRDKRCFAHSCPSVRYWHKRPVSYHKMRALERTDLVDDYNEEMSPHS